MNKKAIITISLVSEAEKESNQTIKKEILEDSHIPWCKQIEKLEIEEIESKIAKS